MLLLLDCLTALLHALQLLIQLRLLLATALLQLGLGLCQAGLLFDQGGDNDGLVLFDRARVDLRLSRLDFGVHLRDLLLILASLVLQLLYLASQGRDQALELVTPLILLLHPRL